MGILGKGLGYGHVCWGTDAIWTGSPQDGRAIASGLSEVGTIKQALLDLEIRRGELAAKLAEPASDEQVISLYPAALDRYLGDIETLQAPWKETGRYPVRPTLSCAAWCKAW